MAADHAAAGKLELDPLHLLTVGELERCAGLQRPPLAVRERHETRLRHRQRVAAGRQLGEIEHAAVVGQHAASSGELDRRREHPCPLDRPAVVGRDHAPHDPAGRRRRHILRLRGRVARRLLAADLARARTRLLGERGDRHRRYEDRYGEGANHHTLLDRKSAARVVCHDFFTASPTQPSSSRSQQTSPSANARRTSSRS